MKILQVAYEYNDDYADLRFSVDEQDYKLRIIRGDKCNEWKQLDGRAVEDFIEYVLENNLVKWDAVDGSSCMDLGNLQPADEMWGKK